jgi:hypothetical protein
MSAGAAMVGSAFGPTNPFQAGIALKLAELPPLASGGLRLATLVIGFVIWVAYTMRYAMKHPQPIETAFDDGRRMTSRDIGILLCILGPFAAYLYGVMRLGWGFDELSAAVPDRRCGRGPLRRARDRRHREDVSRWHASDAAGSEHGGTGTEHLAGAV